MKAQGRLTSITRRASGPVIGKLVVALVPVALAGLISAPVAAHADTWKQPCNDPGKISHDAARGQLLVCDLPTGTWMILPMMPRVAHHDAGTTCVEPGDEALSQDNAYLLTCGNGMWVRGTA